MAKRKEKHQMIWDMFSLVTFSFGHWLGYAFTHGFSIHTAKPFRLFPDIWGLNVLDINVDNLVYLNCSTVLCLSMSRWSMCLHLVGPSMQSASPRAR